MVKSEELVSPVVGGYQEQVGEVLNAEIERQKPFTLFKLLGIDDRCGPGGQYFKLAWFKTNKEAVDYTKE